MKKSNLNQASFVKVTDACEAIEYPLNDKDINAAVIKLNGRYPDKGRTVNQKCKELVYVISGTGTLFVEKEKISLNKGVSIIIEPGEKFYWEGKGLEMFMPCTPAWYPEQHKEVE